MQDNIFFSAPRFPTCPGGLFGAFVYIRIRFHPVFFLPVPQGLLPRYAMLVNGDDGYKERHAGYWANTRFAPTSNAESAL